MAEATAWLRAAHQLIDDEPKIHRDPLVVSLLGEGTKKGILAGLERMQKPYLKIARTLIAVRSRFAEDELAAAIERGVEQYVILGAGLDTSPYRELCQSGKLRIFEVDHPDSQRWKLECLRSAKINIPDNVVYVSVDFERHSLADSLAGAGFDLQRPVFFSWLGVTYYLQLQPVLDMFGYIGDLAPSSQLVFDFLIDDSELSPEERAAVAIASSHAKDNGGEPWVTRFVVEALQAELYRANFSEVFCLSREIATERYLKDRVDGLAMNPAMLLMSAIV
jgi:methyltransferase (TIGR00027 family)